MNKLYTYKGKRRDAVSFYIKSKLQAGVLKTILNLLGFKTYTRAHNGDHEVRVSYKVRTAR